MNAASQKQTASAVDEELRRATIDVLRERGFSGLTLERVAEVGGRARSTLWRQGLSREVLIQALVGELAEDFRVGSSRVDLQACKLEYSIVSPK